MKQTATIKKIRDLRGSRSEVFLKGGKSVIVDKKKTKGLSIGMEVPVRNGRVIL